MVVVVASNTLAPCRSAWNSWTILLLPGVTAACGRSRPTFFPPTRPSRPTARPEARARFACAAYGIAGRLHLRSGVPGSPSSGSWSTRYQGYWWADIQWPPIRLPTFVMDMLASAPGGPSWRRTRRSRRRLGRGPRPSIGPRYATAPSSTVARSSSSSASSSSSSSLRPASAGLPRLRRGAPADPLLRARRRPREAASAARPPSTTHAFHGSPSCRCPLRRHQARRLCRAADAMGSTGSSRPTACIQGRAHLAQRRARAPPDWGAAATRAALDRCLESLTPTIRAAAMSPSDPAGRSRSVPASPRRDRALRLEFVQAPPTTHSAKHQPDRWARGIGTSSREGGRSRDAGGRSGLVASVRSAR